MAKVKLFKEVQTKHVNVFNGKYMSLSPADYKVQNKIHLRENDSITVCGADTSNNSDFKILEGFFNEINCSKCLRAYNKQVKGKRK